jgi:hypothetical protein
VLSRSAALGPACEGDDTVGAELVATPLDANIGLKHIRIRGRISRQVEGFEHVFFESPFENLGSPAQAAGQGGDLAAIGFNFINQAGS